MTDLSIIIVCYKGWERLFKCLDSIHKFTGEALRSEVIVVDNSGDNTIEKFREKFPGFRFVLNPLNGGFANGCNLGARHASGEYFMFLNPDTVVKEQEIEKLLLIARQNPSYGIISCRQVNERGKESVARGSFPSVYNLTGILRFIFSVKQGKSDHGDIFFPDWVSGSLILTGREKFIKAGGFDEDFWMYYEDVDLCRRIRNSGAEIAFCEGITIEHNHGGSSRINLKTTALTKTEVNISRHVYMSKHIMMPGKILIQLFLVLNNIISGAIMGLIGAIFFFIPKLFSRTIIFFSLIKYYTGSLIRLTWISPRSVNSQPRGIHPAGEENKIEA